MRLALLADTHVPTSLPRLPTDLLRQLEGIDAILHAGDLVSLEVLAALERLAPTHAVAGNCDPASVQDVLPQRLGLEIEGHVIGLQHGHQPHDLQSRYIGLAYDTAEMDLFYRAMIASHPEAEIIVFGHFHAPLVKRWQDRLFISPGAITPTYGRSTYATLTFAPAIDVELHEVTVSRDDLRR
ncbi:MAG: metallophosphoesterase family protein [Candidatus Bipolaricaulota bacterium]|nr:MAG: metallophosphoesterase family protein [Candidatus Bipolaricaulota bacterium]